MEFVALDVLEHVQKAKDIHLLKSMEKTARKKVVVFTPNGFLPQTECECKANSFQEHISGWTVNEMRGMGYVVDGINGFKFIRKKKLKSRFGVQSLFYDIIDLSQIITRFFPNWAFQLLCHKYCQVRT